MSRAWLIILLFILALVIVAYLRGPIEIEGFVHGTYLWGGG